MVNPNHDPPVNIWWAWTGTWTMNPGSGATVDLSGVSSLTLGDFTTSGTFTISIDANADDAYVLADTGGIEYIAIDTRAAGELAITGSAETSAVGGGVSITGGATTTAGRGGNVAVTGGAGSGTDNGGSATVAGGVSGGGATGNGGGAALRGGAATSVDGDGGFALALAGNGTGTGSGGVANLTAGAGGTTGTGGDANVTSGASAGASGTAGNVVIDCGILNGGTAGTITIGTSTASAVSVGTGSGDAAVVLPSASVGAAEKSNVTKRLWIPAGVTNTGLILVDATNPPAVTIDGTAGQGEVGVYQFDADGGVTGDDLVSIAWMVPEHYVDDTLGLAVVFSDALGESGGETVVFDATIKATAEAEVWNAAGTAVAAVSNTATTSTQDTIHTSAALDLEVLEIDVADHIVILFWVDESASGVAATLDVLGFWLTWGSNQ